MKLFFAALIVFALAIVGMAIGVLVSNRRIKGSCGGLAGLQDHDGKSICEICSNPSPDCTGENARSEGDKSPTSLRDLRNREATKSPH